jgi:cytochrome c peroxidase
MIQNVNASLMEIRLRFRALFITSGIPAMKAFIVCGLLLANVLPAVAETEGRWIPLPHRAPEPAGNPSSPATVALGKMLFFDPRFSETGTVACASCHNVMEGGDDHRPTSIGVHGLKGGRNAPTVWNAAFLSAQFWDGRAATLEEQAKGPVVNPVEMGMKDLAAAVARIRSIGGYRTYFEHAFGIGEVITIENAAKAVAAYERTLITSGNAYDRYAAGDEHALSSQQQSGMRTFAAVGCTTCHQGPNFSGPALPIGTPFLVKFPVYEQSPFIRAYGLEVDQGRFESTGNEADRHIWRVPTLRNLTYTAPYMHNGAVKSLAEAVRVMASAQLDRTLTDTEVADIVSFLESLTGPFPAQSMPRLPPTPGDLLQ